MTSVEIRRVAVLQPIISDYRIPFYQGLQKALNGHAVELTIFGSRPDRETFLRDGIDALPFATRIPSSTILGSNYWQGSPARFAQYDLVVLQQELRALSNYPVILNRRLFRRPRRIALWGHGTNFNVNTEGKFARGVRRLLNHQVDHFFAYTALSREKFIQRGAPAERITTVNNSIDVTQLLSVSINASPEWKRNERLKFGINSGPVIAFCGRLTRKKNLPFLIEAARLARIRLPGLSLIIIGDGIMRTWIEQSTKDEGWIKLLGARHGIEKDRTLCAADALCMPYDLGLSILDGFAAALPVIVARGARHNPEIAYLQDGQNGRLSELSVEGYASAIVDVLASPEKHESMSRAAISTARTYTMEAMVENFATGVLTALRYTD